MRKAGGAGLSHPTAYDLKSKAVAGGDAGPTGIEHDAG